MIFQLWKYWGKPWVKCFGALGLVVILVTSCGMKTAPYPEATTLPAKIIGLKQTLTESGELILSWKPPQENMVGRKLESLGGFGIEMAEYVADDNYCLGCPHKYTKIDTVPAATPPPGMELAPGPYTWNYKVKEGNVYHFRITALSESGGGHPNSRVVTTVWALSNPGELAGFSASMGDKSVELSWRAPGPNYRVDIQKAHLPAGADEDAAVSWSSIPGLEPNSGRFSDNSVNYENTYLYRGRMVRLKDESNALGPWSAERKVRVIDVTPPNPPGHLDVAQDINGVKLAWESLVFDPDLAGYRVYRQGPGESDFKQIGPKLLKENAYFDPIDLSTEALVRYRVTSVDKSPRANESLASPTVELWLEPPHTTLPRPQE